jgi:hypothetical protein
MPGSWSRHQVAAVARQLGRLAATLLYWLAAGLAVTVMLVESTWRRWRAARR